MLATEFCSLFGLAVVHTSRDLSRSQLQEFREYATRRTSGANFLNSASQLSSTLRGHTTMNGAELFSRRYAWNAIV